MAAPIFGLNIAQPPGQTAGPGFDVINYAEFAAANNNTVSVPVSAAQTVYLDNRGGRVFVVQLQSGQADFSLVLDAHARLPVQLGVPLDTITLVDLTGIQTFMGLYGQLGAGPMEALPDEVSGLQPGGGCIVVTTSDVPFGVMADTRQAANRTLHSTLDSQPQTSYNVGAYDGAIALTAGLDHVLLAVDVASVGAGGSVTPFLQSDYGLGLLTVWTGSAITTVTTETHAFGDALGVALGDTSRVGFTIAGNACQFSYALIGR